MKKRTISAAIMIIVLVPLLIIGGIPFRIAMGIIAALGYKEILDLKGIKNYPKFISIIGLVVLLVLLYSSHDILGSVGLGYEFLAFAFLALLAPTIFYFGDKSKYSTSDAFKLLGFILFLGISLNIITNLVVYEKKLFILILLVSTLTDTFAYLTGMAIGKHKGVTKISPNKSIEGFIGGILMGTSLTTIYYVTFIGDSTLIRIIPVVLLLSISCCLGDLFFSAIKREKDIKDFSNLIPGHGGVLDRIDSITFVALMFVLLRGLL